MPPSPKPRNRLKGRIALLLSFSAGFVDIVGFLAVYRAFAAHMTGNTVHLGNDLIEGNWGGSLVAVTVLGSFVAGSVLGRMIIEAAARRKLRTVASLTLGAEALMLVGCVLLSSVASAHRSAGETCLLLALLAGSMGLQTATLTRIGPLTVHTTFVTGMLNKFAQLVSHALFQSYDLARTQDAAIRIKRRDTISQASFIFAVWAFYLAGATSGSALASRWTLHALYLPVVLIGFAIVADQFKPLAVEEEKDQSER
jgi:uncharacterized membrane protein YoaK (UPF0700 family)